jgi:hypothetical protein
MTYIDLSGAKSTRQVKKDPMAFKPNYGRDRAERERAARARSEDKQKKRDEKAALPKGERAAADPPPDDKQS